MEYQELLWMAPDKVGVLKRMHMGERTNSWQTRRFVVKDNFLFYFKIPSEEFAAQDCEDPVAVIPLKACKVDFSPIAINCYGGDMPPAVVFVIFLPDSLVKRGVIERNTYFLGCESFAECRSWMKAIKCAARSKRATKAQLQHAKMELLDLRKQMKMCGATNEGPKEACRIFDSFGLRKHSTARPKEDQFDSSTVQKENTPLLATYEDSVLLQALSDELMIQYSLLQFEKEA
ncbi:unnamed protein product [Calypogeia fissa]